MGRCCGQAIGRRDGDAVGLVASALETGKDEDTVKEFFPDLQ